jgi:hypothetical protein
MRIAHAPSPHLAEAPPHGLPAVPQRPRGRPDALRLQGMLRPARGGAGRLPPAARARRRGGRARRARRRDAPGGARRRGRARAACGGAAAPAGAAGAVAGVQPRPRRGHLHRRGGRRVPGRRARGLPRTRVPRVAHRRAPIPRCGGRGCAAGVGRRQRRAPGWTRALPSGSGSRLQPRHVLGSSPGLHATRLSLSPSNPQLAQATAVCHSPRASPPRCRR